MVSFFDSEGSIYNWYQLIGKKDSYTFVQVGIAILKSGWFQDKTQRTYEDTTTGDTKRKSILETSSHHKEGWFWNPYWSIDTSPNNNRYKLNTWRKKEYFLPGDQAKQENM